MPDDMKNTMDEINLLEASLKRGRRDTLLRDILRIENELKQAEGEVGVQVAFSPTSPEAANAEKRKTIFLKKELGRAKASLEDLENG